MEGHEISKLAPGTFLNRKGEWGQNLPPKLTVEDSDDPQTTKTQTRGKRKDTAPRKPLQEIGTPTETDAVDTQRLPKKLKLGFEGQRERGLVKSPVEEQNERLSKGMPINSTTFSFNSGANSASGQQDHTLQDPPTQMGSLSGPADLHKGKCKARNQGDECRGESLGSGKVNPGDLQGTSKAGLDTIRYKASSVKPGSFSNQTQERTLAKVLKRKI